MTPTREQIQQKAFRHWHRDRDNIEYFDAVSFWEEAFAAGQQAEREKLELALKVYRGDVCYKSKEDDQSYGMWCPVTTDYLPPFPEGTELYRIREGQ